MRTAAGFSILGVLVWGMVVHPLYTIGVLLVGHGVVWLVKKVGKDK
jgi:hypothetical protein